ncbi:DNA helicase RecQ [Evansella sp. AB-rgal1]|uniref:DNA helicase RecQ n=1 Tax=Evansella sp. AB-rgal1 TaxID=3242696 RepID=UPI00359DA533
MITEATTLLKQHFGYDSFRPGQEEIIINLLNSHRTMGIMPTGGGKSICYQIPSLMLPGITLVISPLISLMKDQVDELNEAGIAATFINSSLKNNEVNERLEQMKQGGYKLVYIAPERLETPSFLHALSQLHVSLIAVDEAHCLSQWGHDFRPSYMKIPNMIEQLHDQPTILALTATSTPEVTADICSALSINNDFLVKTGFARENLSFNILKGEDRDSYILDYVETNKGQSGIIYAATRKEVERLYTVLESRGISVGKYHGGMTNEERESMQELFVYDELQLMIATNAFGMGINKSNVRYVIHYQIPRNIESYYQEAGRAGRDGEESECILLFSPQDIRIQQFLIEQSTLHEGRKDNELRKLQAMANYCHTESCLQSYILDYFGDSIIEPCGKCIHCRDERDSEDVTTDAQMVFSCIKRMRENFGKTIVAQVLVGSGNKRVKDLSFHTLSTYGLMKDRTQKDVSQFIDFLIASQYVSLSDGSFPTLQLTEKAIQVLKGEIRVERKQETKKVTVVKSHPLFEKLRELRSSLAKDANVPPYVIFSDKTLNEMCAILPTNQSDMLKVKGVGEQKYEKYGNIFIKAISEFLEENPDIEKNNREYHTSPVIRNKNADVPISHSKTPSHFISSSLYKEGKTIKEIAEIRSITPMTVESHLLRAMEEGDELNLYSLVSDEDKDRISKSVELIGVEDGLRPIKEDLPEDISYFSIKIVLQQLATN